MTCEFLFPVIPSTLPFYVNLFVPSCFPSDQAAKSAIVFRSQSHSTLHQLAAAAEDSNEPSLEPRPTLSRPSSSHHLSSLVEDGSGLGGGGGGGVGGVGGGCGGSNSATAATSEAEASVSTPPEGSFSLHHNDPIYGRHRGAHGSHRLHHEMSLQECQMALDVAVDEAEEEAASPEDRAHLHHTADPKLMRKRGELFEWSQRHKAPKQSQVRVNVRPIFFRRFCSKTSDPHTILFVF